MWGDCTLRPTSLLLPLTLLLLLVQLMSLFTTISTYEVDYLNAFASQV